MKKQLLKTMLLGVIMAFGAAANLFAETKSVTYAIQKDETHKAGETVEVKSGNDVVATLTFGFADGADFKAGAEHNTLKDKGFTAYTEGNGENGKPESGTVYIIKPQYDGTIEVGVVLNADKKFYVLEDGTALSDFNGITVTAKYYGTYKFNVKAGKEYKVYADGTKLGFYGFIYSFDSASSAGGSDDNTGDNTGGNTGDNTGSTVILSWNEEPTLSTYTDEAWEYKGEKNNVATWKNGCSLMIMRSDKDYSSALTLNIDGKDYKTIKLSNGAQNKLTLPEGKVTKKITLYSYVNNADPSSAYWKEVAGKTYTKEETGMKAHTGDGKVVGGADKYEFTFDATNEVTFTNGGTQCCFVLFVEVEDAPAVEEPEPDAPSTIPITEDFEGKTNIFEGGVVSDDAKVGSKVLVLNNTTATASFSPAYTLAKNEKVTFKFTAYQGWVSGGGLATATVKNSEGQDLVSYTFDHNACNVTDVAIGGTTVEGFEAFFGQSNYNNNGTNKGSGNQFSHSSQPFVGTEGYNPQVTLSISGAGVVEFNLQYTANGSQDTNVSYSGTLPEGTTIDLGSFVLASTAKGDGFGIDNLSITTATEENVEDPALAEMKEFLSQMVAQYEGADLSGYTEESAATLTKAIEDVKAEIANPNATEESLMAAYLALGAALEGLEEKPAGSWELVGTAILEDPWVLPGLGIDQHLDENKWEVPLERNTANENLYRLVDPYHAEGPVKAYNESVEVGYITFDVTDPDHVLFSSNTGAGFKNRNKEVIATRVSEVYAYNRLTQRYYHKENGKKDLATVIADYGEKIPFTTFKDGVITLGSITVDGETIYDACFGDETDPQGFPDGFDWENGADMTGTITLKIGGAGDEDPVGISTVNAEAANGAIYNLQGQKVEKAQKGLYIINGKKVVVK